MMHFHFWSYEKKKLFMNSLKFKSRDDIFKQLKAEGFEMFPKGNGMLAINNDEYYYLQFGLRKRNFEEQVLKKKYRHRYIIVR